MHRYRSDIDGLRAIAVSVVVLFHAGLPGCSGGYLGVDVFFVVSGFLITQILTAETGGATSVTEFYERRIRRIVPALAALLVCCTIAALILLTPYEMKQFGTTVAAVTTFVANFKFMFMTDYFDPVSTDNPLLHLWSLSVEEQFYLVYPLLLWLAGRRSKRMLAPVLAG